MSVLTSPVDRDQFWTADEFLDWLEPGVRADLIRGYLHMHSPATLRRANLLNFIDTLLGIYVRKNGLGVVHRGCVAVKLTRETVVMPDAAFFTNKQTELFEETVVPVAPTFVIEAVSPSSIDRDNRDKFALYEENGVQEYWILNPDNLSHRFFRREGEFLKQFAQNEEIIRSASVPGFWVKRGWLTANAQPLETDCLELIEQGAR